MASDHQSVEPDWAALVEAMADARRRKDEHALMRLFDANAVLVDAAFERPRRGHGHIAETFRDLFQAAPDLRFEVAAGPLVSADGREAAVLWHGRGSVEVAEGQRATIRFQTFELYRWGKRGISQACIFVRDLAQAVPVHRSA